MDNDPRTPIEPVTPADPQPGAPPPVPPFTPGEEPEGPAPITPAPISPEVPTVTEQPRADRLSQVQSQAYDEALRTGVEDDDPDDIAEDSAGL